MSRGKEKSKKENNNCLFQGCILFHLISKDYEYDSKPSTEDYKVDNSTLSMFFGGLLIGSRLHDEYQMFALLFTTLL